MLTLEVETNLVLQAHGWKNSAFIIYVYNNYLNKQQNRQVDQVPTFLITYISTTKAKQLSIRCWHIKREYNSTYISECALESGTSNVQFTELKAS